MRLVRALAAATLALACTLVALPATQTQAAAGCSVSYSVVNQWNNNPTSGGFQTNLAITNSGTTTFTGWTLAFAFPNGQSIGGLWNATFSQTGANVTVSSNQTWNQTIAPGGVMNSVGFTGAWSGANGVPTSFSVNGVVCGGAAAPTATPTVAAATNTATRTPTAVAGATSTPTVPPAATNTPTRTPTAVVGATSTPTRTPTVPPAATNTPTRTPTVPPAATNTPTRTPTVPPAATNTPTPIGPTATPTPSPTPPPAGTHLDNPFAGARGYVNANWAANVNALAAQTGGPLGQHMSAIATTSTAVWMDRIAAIDGGAGVLGLRDHLNAAVTQSTQSGQPVAILMVVYDLPNRDCAALASNGELLIAQDGLNRYKTEYINRIASIFADPAYTNLRIVAIVEPDSIPNLVTNLNIQPCQEAESTGAYVEGVRYAINTLKRPNVYLYLDIAHSGWLGWPSNFNPALDRFTNLLTQGSASVPAPGANSIDGFISNTANYTPVEEPFLPDPNQQVGGNPIMNSTFFEFNPHFDERDYATDLRNAFVQRGLTGPNNTSIGMLIDTSRDGWGCAQNCPLGARPTQVSTSTVTSTFVDESRIDRRPHRGGWCNQNGAGIGARPQANPFAGVDAFVWVKPPGESDGTSTNVPDPQDPAKKFDAMCDPAARNRYNNAFPTNALPNAPHAGRWFPEQFAMLVQNAFPAIQP